MNKKLKELTYLQLDEILDDILIKSKKDLKNVQWIQDIIYSQDELKKSEIDDFFCEYMAFFYYYLIKFEKEERYEICSKIKKAIKAQKRETLVVFKLIDKKKFNAKSEVKYLNDLDDEIYEYLKTIYN